MNTEVLNSWKEIAAYLGRGVRTVQRWEQELGLPVRRPRGKERSAVIALKPDIDLWLHHVPQSAEISHRDKLGRHLTLQINTEQMIKCSQALLERSGKMADLVRKTVAITTHLKAQQAQRMAANKVSRENQRTLMAKQVTLALELQEVGGAKFHGDKPTEH